MVDRAAVLAGVRAALNLHGDLGTRAGLEVSGGRVDVFGDVARCGATLYFGKLDGLLGAYVPGEEPGVLITTERPLSVQRFTAAHELGHHVMGHEPSLDDEGILRRPPFSERVRGVPRQEREADAFASAYLVPAWLVALHKNLQGWTRPEMADPCIAYQASLRFGSSYQATVHALERHKAITEDDRARLLDVEPKRIKQDLLPAGSRPPSWRGDVWLLTERDEGRVIEGSREDLFVLRLRENSGAGYLWNFDELARAGFAVLRDERERPGDAIGGPVLRTVTALAPEGDPPSPGELQFLERRPWQPHTPLSEYHLRYDLRGPERRGMWEPERRRLLEAA